ncbi:unnamed protein product [Acanthoscelides obtectus]|uniref:Uncharacterized protein n=1 Tax=Acanthoscelides obtectus TaxID=200917 RepID=A0A9P0LTE9_ACAOB|nr:unnamed protein product [Acanthoscelides obtectus]CAK1632705.1 hypothetical protein AOBTE_LOCUS7689 [Acanthoscelides obtectus]
MSQWNSGPYPPVLQGAIPRLFPVTGWIVHTCLVALAINSCPPRSSLGPVSEDDQP